MCSEWLTSVGIIALVVTGGLLIFGLVWFCWLIMDICYDIKRLKERIWEIADYVATLKNKKKK